MTINDLIRRGAGHQPLDVAPIEQHKRIGQIGIGRGGACGPPRACDIVAERFNAELRLSAGVVRGRYSAVDVIENV